MRILNRKKGESMFRQFRNQKGGFLASLLIVSVLTLLISANSFAGGSDSGGKKGCNPKACTRVCPLQIKTASDQGAQTEEPNAGYVLNLKDSPAVELYTCSMHPEVRAEKAGSCPECGMKLTAESFYQVYACTQKECVHPCIKATAGKCCGKDLQKMLMSKDEIYLSAQLEDEYFCPMHAQVVSDKTGKCPQCGMNLEIRTVHQIQSESSPSMSYVCPKHSDHICAKPGNCSKCGMLLKEKEVITEKKSSD
jgi:hypothetical protein